MCRDSFTTRKNTSELQDARKSGEFSLAIYERNNITTRKDMKHKANARSIPIMDFIIPEW